MAEYRRLISYMYNYENGVKKNNVGFAKIELRNGQCKITINIKVASLNGQNIKTYIFFRENEQMVNIYLADAVVKNGVLEWKGITNARSIMNTGHPFEQMGGLLLYFTLDQYFATEWDDKPVRLAGLEEWSEEVENRQRKEQQDREKELVMIQVPREEVVHVSRGRMNFPQREPLLAAQEVTNEENKMMGETETSDTHVEEVKTINLTEQNQQGDLQTSSQEVAVTDCLAEQDACADVQRTDRGIWPHQDSLYPSRDNLSQGIEEKAFTEAERIEEKVTKDTAALVGYRFLNWYRQQEPSERKLSAVKEILSHPEMEQHITEKSNDYLQGFSDLQDSKQWKAGFEKEMKSASKKISTAEKILEKYPAICPFEDDEIIKCVRIEPGDIGLFPIENWVLGNNSFLLHGYYNYRHLIFAKRKLLDGFEYILGVPGVFYNREKFMAKMFGFNQFKSSKLDEQKTGQYGYWYVKINMD
ncbi:MAG TPA: DUF6128 domain-containing protein [Lachnospiraceae bacterium]|nr:DUF6128 domain-containing protein [Lachnospiraceae bacterium]